MIQNQILSLNKLVIDKIKKNDLKQIFQILMILPQNRTIADINTLTKIIINIEPIKQIKNFSAIYYCCKNMYLGKFKQKDFIFQKKQDSQSLYIILNGKVGLYKRSNDQYQCEQVLFLDQGSCFGKLFDWKIKFIPLALEQTLIAILPKRQFNKIGIVINIEKQTIMKEIKTSGMIPLQIGEQKFRSISHTFVFNRIPHGNYLIKSGQTPKVIFLILKGMVKKVIQIPKNELQIDIKVSGYYNSFDMYSVSHYSTGDYFPKNNLNNPTNYSLITQCASEIITIPKKALRSIGYEFNSQSKQNQNLNNNGSIVQSNNPSKVKNNNNVNNDKDKYRQKDNQYYKQELQKQKNWNKYKQNIINQVIKNNKINKQKHKFFSK